MPTVLVVDDEKMICRMLSRILEHEGFTVITAGSGTEALSAVRSHSAPIDLLISDMSLGGMDGPSVAVELLALEPAMKVLFISGEEQKERCLGFEFMEKPFALSALVAKVRSLLHVSQTLGAGR
jgi:DNA-binding response OmpR family regulator